MCAWLLVVLVLGCQREGGDPLARGLALRLGRTSTTGSRIGRRASHPTACAWRSSAARRRRSARRCSPKGAARHVRRVPGARRRERARSLGARRDVALARRAHHHDDRRRSRRRRHDRDRAAPEEGALDLRGDRRLRDRRWARAHRRRRVLRARERLDADGAGITLANRRLSDDGMEATCGRARRPATAGKTLEDVRQCIDEVVDQAQFRFDVDVMFVEGTADALARLPRGDRGRTRTSTAPCPIPRPSPSPTICSRISRAVPHRLVARSWQFDLEDPTRRGAYLRHARVRDRRGGRHRHGHRVELLADHAALRLRLHVRGHACSSSISTPT